MSLRHCARWQKPAHGTEDIQKLHVPWNTAVKGLKPLKTRKASGFRTRRLPCWARGHRFLQLVSSQCPQNQAGQAISQQLPVQYLQKPDKAREISAKAERGPRRVQDMYVLASRRHPRKWRVGRGVHMLLWKGSNCLLRSWNLPSLPESNSFKPKETELLLNSKSGCSYSIAPIISKNNVI